MGSAPNYTIDAAWPNRVAEIVNHCLANDIYEIINVHHDDNIIVSLHAYTPYFFAMDPNATASWRSYSDKYELDQEFDRYYNKFVAKGIPVVIGEFGSINKNNTAARAELARYIVSAAKERNIACIWWDNNGVIPNEWENFGLFNRNTLTWYFPEIVNAMINASK